MMRAPVVEGQTLRGGLFLKIFLWFCLAILLVGSAYLGVEYLTASEDPRSLMRTIMRTALDEFANEAGQAYVAGGAGELDRYVAELESETGIRGILFDPDDVVVTRGAVPEGAPELATRTRAGERPRFDFSGQHPLVASQWIGPDGREYIFISRLPRRFSSLSESVGVMALRLSVVLLVALGVCYWLARHLATPVLKLRTATRQLARGDLTARVGERLGNRHDELADLGRDFDTMASRLEALHTSQQRLLGDISHELRSPLTRLSVALGLARKRSSDGAAAAHDRIEREAERLNVLIGQLLAMTRIDVGAEGLSRRAFDLDALVGEIALDSDFEARSRDRAVRVVAREPVSIEGDPALVRSAIENVVRNAVRYTDEGTAVEISLESEANGDGRWAVVTVRDHGPGVPESTLEDLFRPFYRVAEARDRRTGGVGLGLAITERAVRLHGGTASAVNAHGGGLAVQLTFPSL